jgi:hypothetical protein
MSLLPPNFDPLATLEQVITQGNQSANNIQAVTNAINHQAAAITLLNTQVSSLIMAVNEANKRIQQLEDRRLR